VLDPAGLRVDLAVLDRIKLLEVAVSAQPVRFGGSRALVDADDERRHESGTSDEWQDARAATLGEVLSGGRCARCMDSGFQERRIHFLRPRNGHYKGEVYYFVLGAFSIYFDCQH
jgi:hypothetical protein